MIKPSLTKKLRTWYGLTLTLRFYGTHWAAVGPMPPHPQLINLVLRMGLPEEDSLHLQILHELGHLQSLPFMILLGIVTFLLSWSVSMSLAGLFVTWEILSEGYVFFREKGNYLSIYRRQRGRQR